MNWIPLSISLVYWLGMPLLGLIALELDMAIASHI